MRDDEIGDEMGEMDMLRLQGTMEQLQLESMVSNALHSTTEAESSIDGKEPIKSDLDSMSEMGEMESLRLRLASLDAANLIQKVSK